MPPPNLPTHLSHKSALVLLPHTSITRPIEQIRRSYDKQFHRWPPHINLIYPFLASPSVTGGSRDESKDEDDESNQLQPTVHNPSLKEEIAGRVSQVAKQIQPFQLLLRADPPGTFMHGKGSSTVWLRTSSNGSNEASTRLIQLQALLQSEFSECNADNRPFTPHLSLGQGSKQQGYSTEDVVSAVEKVFSEISPEVGKAEKNDISTGLSWYVDEVHVIERKGFHGRFKIIGSVKLG